MRFNENLETAMEHYSKTGAFLTVNDGTATNTMTVSWGFIGYMWRKPYFITVVRPTRYTFKIIEKAEDFTISLPFGTMKEELNICGTKSGADIDKSKVVEFIPAQTVKSPVVNGCDMFYECRITYRDVLKKESVPADVLEKFYNDDLHYVYFGEIVNCYSK